MFFALVIGLASGILFYNPRLPGFATALAIAQAIGKLWLDALSMTVVPLIFGLLVTGVMTAARVGSASRIGWRAMIWFTLLLTVACLLAAAATTVLLGWWPVSPMTVSGPDALWSAVPAATGWLQAIAPMNPIKAAAETAIVPLVFFAILFGLAAARIESDLGDAILTVVRAVVETMLVLVRWILVVAPIGIAGLAFAAGAKMGAGAAETLVQYIIVIAAICLLITLMVYVVVGLAGGISLLRFARAAAPAQAVALGTQSSLASLPVMIQAAPSFDVSPAVAGIILPLSVSLFRAASAAANVAVAIYLGHVHGIALPWETLLLGAMVAIPVSLAAVGLPAQVSFFATIGPVCLAMGVPIEALPLLLAVESVPDLFRTVGNVTADLAVVRLAGREMR
ncbi:dicarboxylate/amino acid:cation symporter [Sphingobium sufflavum]|nr:dicarboxylate/amino acid:cation symporter [Sphingobium sufflavum]